MIDKLFPRYKNFIIGLCFLSWLLPTAYLFVWGKHPTMLYIIFALISIALLPIGYGMGLVVIGLMASNPVYSRKTVDQFCQFVFFGFGVGGIIMFLAFPLLWYFRLSRSDDFSINGCLGGFGIAWAAYNLRKKYVLNWPKRG
jgi:hypothetical protein